MKPGIPWSVKGIDGKAREVAKDAARSQGMTLGEWLNSKILEAAEDDADLKKRATRRKSSSSTGSAKRKPAKSRTAAPARAKSQKSAPKRAEKSADDEISRKLDLLADRISALSDADPDQPDPAPRRGSQRQGRALRDTGSPHAYDQILQRVEQGEERMSDALSELGGRMDQITTRVDELADKPLNLKAQQVPGFTALEGAVRNIVDHIERSEKQSRETMAGLQEKISRLSDPAAAPDRPSSKDLAKLESRMQDLSARLETISDQEQGELKALFEARIRELAERIDTVRHSAETIGQNAEVSASKAAEQHVRQLEERMADLVRQAEQKLAAGGPGEKELNGLQREISALKKRFEEVRTQAASDQEVRDLRAALENLSSRVDEQPDPEPIQQIETRIAELSRQMQELAQPEEAGAQFVEIEERLQALGSQIAEATQSGQADTGVTEKIETIEKRLAATEKQLGGLETIETSIKQLFKSLEDSREQAREVAEEAASKAVQQIGEGDSAAAGGSAEMQALEESLAAVRANAEAADQRTQETLEAVHETLSQIITKLGELDGAAAARGDHDRPVATDLQDAHTAASTAAAAAAAAADAPGTDAPASGCRPETQPPGSDDPAAAGSDRDEPFAPFGTPHDEAVPNLKSAAPGADAAHRAAGQDWVSVVQAHLHETGQAQGMPETPATGQAPSAGAATTAHEDFIAAARRAATGAAEPAPGSPTFSSASPAAFGDLPDADQDRAAQGLASLFSRSAKTNASKKDTKDETKPASRKRLLLAALVLLAAFSAYTMQSGVSRQSEETRTSLMQQRLTQTSTQTSTLAKPEAVTPLARQPVSVAAPALPAPAGTTPEQSASDPITTASIDTGDAATDPLLSSAPKVDAGFSAPQPSAPVSETDTGELPGEIGTEALRLAASSGDPNAQFIVASRYLEGRVVGRNYEAAARWYTRAAKAGLAAAQYRIGTLHERGSGVVQNRVEAMRWYEKAARQGNVKAMHNLAVLKADSTLGTPDMEKAAHWFARAAAHGLPDSQYNLAVLHERGLGISKDLEAAYKWYSLAARQGDRDAIAKSAELKAALDADTLTRADARLKDWQPERPEKSANLVNVSDPAWGLKPPPSRTAAAAATGPVEPLTAREQIRQAQELLSKKGFDPGSADGEMGSRTANAIRLYQLRNGLPVNGSVSQQLLDHLQNSG